ncbi:MAG: DoxX family membrane protein [Deltaproteobacteria bacterium]
MNQRLSFSEPVIIRRVFRVMVASIFVVAGLGHVLRPETMTAKLVAAPVGAWIASVLPADPLMVASGVVLVVAGVVFAVGGRGARTAAWVLLVLLVPITISTHLGKGPDGVGPLFKNVAIAGALLHFVFARPRDS